MKGLFLSLMLVCGVANANESCDSTADFAETVMKYKQQGISFEVSKVAINKTMDRNEPLYGEFMAIIEWAYARPNYENEMDKQSEIKAFGNIVRKACNEVYTEQGWKD